MERAIFKTENEENVFVVTKSELKDFTLPMVGHRITLNKTYMFVTAVEHDYDDKSFIVTVKIM